MSITKTSDTANRISRAAYRSARRNRPSLSCEILELRQLLSADAAAASASQLTAQPSLTVVPLVSTGPTGYSPQQIQTAYGINDITFSGGTVKGDGDGETIAIVDAYNDPDIASDLAKFDSAYGLSAPPSFTVDNLGGRRSTTNAGWALEESLDVEWAHAIAPDAKIILVEAASSNLNNLFSAVSYASDLPGVSVVSMSWGTEEFFGEARYDSIFTTPAGHTPVTYVASSGDSGAWDGPMYPSVSPNVVAVGGTSLTLNANGTYDSETGWTDSTGGFSGLDMNFWYYEQAPSYQVAAQESVGLDYGPRTTPDVSFNADPNTGVAVYDSVSYSGQSGWFEVGGTSAAAPAWAGLIAITDQGLALAGKSALSSTQTLTDLYSLPSSDFNDITTGFNGYSATAGYDLVTGLGTPKSNLLVAGLLSENGVSSSVVTNTSVATPTVSSNSGATSTHRAYESVSITTPATIQTQTVATSLPVQVVGVLPTQTSSTTNTGSDSQATQQDSTTTTAASTGANTTSLGQSVSPPRTSSGDQGTTDDTQTLDPVDSPELTMPPATPPETPAGQADAPDAAPRKAPEPSPPPESPAPSVEPMTDPTPTVFDIALESMGAGWSGPRSHGPNEPRVVVPEKPAREDVEASSATPSLMSAGTAVAAAGAYWFTLTQADRKKYRRIPGRI